MKCEKCLDHCCFCLSLITGGYVIGACLLCSLILDIVVTLITDALFWRLIVATTFHALGFLAVILHLCGTWTRNCKLIIPLLVYLCLDVVLSVTSVVIDARDEDSRWDKSNDRITRLIIYLEVCIGVTVNTYCYLALQSLYVSLDRDRKREGGP